MISRRKSLALIALALAFSAPRARGAEPAADIVNHVKRAVVVVNSFDARGRLLTQGSGFFVGRALVVTNLHVVGTAARVEVRTFDGETYAVAGLRAYDPARDLALLEAAVPAPAQPPALRLADAPPRPSEEIFVVSHPRGAEWRVTRGRALAPWLSQELGEMIPFTAAVSRGSSGGPVLNLEGRVVGVATMSFSGPREFHLAVPGGCAAALRPEALRPFPLLAAD